MQVRARVTKILFGRAHSASNVGRKMGSRVSNALPNSVAVAETRSMAAPDSRDLSELIDLFRGKESERRVLHRYSVATPPCSSMIVCSTRVAAAILSHVSSLSVRSSPSRTRCRR